jgi:hypothetical protein
MAIYFDAQSSTLSLAMRLNSLVLWVTIQSIFAKAMDAI